MKKVLLGLVFALFTLQANAAFMSWDRGASTQGIIFDKDNSDLGITAHAAANDGIFSPFTIDFVFNLNDNQDTAIAAIEFFDSQIDMTSVTLDGIANSFTLVGEGGNLAEWRLNPTLNLGAGNHTIHMNLNSASAGAQIDVKVGAVPLPAAVWLFGSALMGLVGVSRRKSSAVAA